MPNPYVCSTFPFYNTYINDYVTLMDCIEWDTGTMGPIVGQSFATKEQCYDSTVCNENLMGLPNYSFGTMTILSVDLLDVNHVNNSITVSILLPQAYGEFGDCVFDIFNSTGSPWMTPCTKIYYTWTDRYEGVEPPPPLPPSPYLDTPVPIPASGVYTIGGDNNNGPNFHCGIKFQLINLCPDPPGSNSGSGSGSGGNNPDPNISLLPPFLLGSYYLTPGFEDDDPYVEGEAVVGLHIYNFNDGGVGVQVERRYHPGGFPPGNAPSGPGPWTGFDTTGVPGGINPHAYAAPELYKLADDGSGENNVICCWEYRVRFYDENYNYSEWASYSEAPTFENKQNLVAPEIYGGGTAEPLTVVNSNDIEVYVQIQLQYVPGPLSQGPWLDAIAPITIGPNTILVPPSNLQTITAYQWRARFFTLEGSVSPWSSISDPN